MVMANPTRFHAIREVGAATFTRLSPKTWGIRIDGTVDIGSTITVPVQKRNADMLMATVTVVRHGADWAGRPISLAKIDAKGRYIHRVAQLNDADNDLFRRIGAADAYVPVPDIDDADALARLVAARLVRVNAKGAGLTVAGGTVAGGGAVDLARQF